MSFRNVSAPPIPAVPTSPSAPALPASATPALGALGAPFETTDPELVALARSLRNDPDLIYEFVRNTIITLPMGGSLKGPLGALLDGAGTSFDQAELMAVLLKLAGYTPTFVVGRIRIDAAQLASWVDADTSVITVDGFLVSGALKVVRDGGLAPADIIISGSEIVSLTVDWAWVKVSISGTSYVFDPATKSYARTVGVVSSLNTRMGYDRAAFLNSALSGAIIGPNELRNVNRGNLRTAIAGYSTALVANIRSQLANAGPDDLLGGATIVPLPLNTMERQQSLGYAVSAQDFPDVPADRRTRLTVTLPGTSPVIFTSAEIYGRRLSLFFNTSIAPVLRLDGVERAIGSAATAGNQVGIGIAIDHPYPGGFADQTGTQNVQASAGGAFILSNGWGPVGRAMIERHRRFLQENSTASGATPVAEPVLGESLAMLGYTWLAECSRTQHLCERLGNTKIFYHHGVGIVGMGAVLPPPAPQITGPYVDLPFNFFSTVQRRAVPATNDRTPTEIAAFIVVCQLQSVLESGAIEQTQPGVPAVSTVKLLDIASQAQPIYDVTTVAVFDAIRPQLQNYTTTFLDSLRVRVSQGYREIIHQNGQIQVNAWRGFGYFEIGQSVDSFGSIIAGGFNGGFPTVDRPPSEVNLYAGLQIQPQTQSSLNTLLGLSPGDSYSVLPVGGDPLNLVTGDYVLSHDDLTVGTGAFPYALAMQRSYDSGRSGSSSGLGPGWRHGFDLTVTPDSDGFEGMAATSPQNGATSVAALYIMLDILNLTGSHPLERLVVATLVSQYWMEQLINNVLRVARPGAVESFVRLANASYGAPIASNSVLTANANGTYTLQTGDGITLQFGAATQTQPGRITSWNSPAGAQVTFTYGTNSLVVATNLGRSLTLTYAGDLLQTVSDGTRSVSYRYDAAGRLEFFRDPLGQDTRFAYDGSSSRLKQIFYPSFPAVAFVTNTYDGLGRVMEQRDGANNLTQVFVAGRRTELLEPSSNRHVWYFAPLGQVLLEIQDYGRNNAGALRPNLTTRSGYDGQSRLISTTLQLGDRTEIAYDAYSNPLTVTRYPKPGSPLAPLVQTFTYTSPMASRPNFRRIATETDPRLNTTTYAYDPANGNLLTVTQPAVIRAGGTTPTNPVTTYTWTTLGLMASERDAESRLTTHEYDGAGNRIAQTMDAGTGRLNLRTTWTYDGIGNVTSTVSARGNVVGADPEQFRVTRIVDAKRRVTQLLQASTGLNTTYAYDADDRVLREERIASDGVNPPATLTTTTTYTPTGQRSVVTDPSGNTITYAYDGSDRLLSATSSSGRQTRYGYDRMSRLTTVHEDVSGILDPSITVNRGSVLRETRTYTQNSLLASLMDANGNTTTYTYDGYDRLRQTIHPPVPPAASLVERHDYDSNGNVVFTRTRASQDITVSYDALNRPLTRAIPANADAPAVTYTMGYDLVGRILRLRQSTDAADVIYAYDTAGRQVGETRPDGRVIGTLRDADGNVTRLTWPESGSQAYEVTYAYDPLGRVSGIFEGAGTAGLWLGGYVYDTASRRLSLTRGNLTGTNWTWRPDGRVQTVSHAYTGGASVAFTYFYNREGGVSARTVSDVAYQATVAVQPSTSFTTNALNQYGTVGSSTLSYDLNGNLLEDGTTSYRYDTQSRLVRLIRGSTDVSYTYDAEGRQATRTVAGGGTTRFLYAMGQEIAEYTGTAPGSLARRHVPGPGLDEPLATVTGNTANRARRYYHADAQGSVIARTDDGGGAPAAAERYAYRPFRQLTAGIGTGQAAFRWLGRRQESLIGVYDMRARAYLPALGRFLQPDPIGITGGLNLYAYVRNNPLNATDPSGLYVQFLAGAAFGLATDVAFNSQEYSGLSWSNAILRGMIAAGSGAAGAGATAAIVKLGILAPPLRASAGGAALEIVAGVAGAGFGNSVQQGVQLEAGLREKPFSVSEALAAATLGGVASVPSAGLRGTSLESLIPASGAKSVLQSVNEARSALFTAPSDKIVERLVLSDNPIGQSQGIYIGNAAYGKLR